MSKKLRSDHGGDLAQAIKERRLEKGLTQGELAQKSRVSLRTISLVEKGHIPGPAVILQLANTLGRDPKEWTQLGGRENTKLSAVARFPGETDPHIYFDSLLAALPKSGHILMSPSYTSVPGALHRPDIFSKLIDLVNGGLWMGMTFPYPDIRGEIGRKTRLILFYRNVLTQMKGMAEDLRSAVAPDKKERVNIFVPKLIAEEGALPIVMPTSGLGEYRPTFVKFAKAPEGRPAEELAAWFKLAGEQKDRWVPIYPDAGLMAKGAQSIQAFNCWRDYFSDIIEQWEKLTADATNQRGWLDGTFPDWKIILGNEASKSTEE
jgi:transcriptional regulator with XRE-family HTH domain